jgi:hypothetical protein
MFPELYKTIKNLYDGSRFMNYSEVRDRSGWLVLFDWERLKSKEHPYSWKNAFPFTRQSSDAWALYIDQVTKHEI